MWTEIYENVGGTWIKQAQNGPSGTWSVSGRGSGTYRYSVRDCMQDGSGVACMDMGSATVTVTLTAPIPASPVQVAASQSGTSIAVSWSSVSGATYYNLYGRGALLQKAAVTNYVDSGVSAGASYTYRVEACNDNGCSTSTDSNTVVMNTPPPAAPASVTATSDGSYVYLSWTPVSGNVLYTIQQVGQSTTFTTSLTTLVDAEVAAGNTYSYLVKACLPGVICSPYTRSNSVTITPPIPATPKGLTIVASGSSFVLSWGAVSGATSYTLQKTAGSVSNIPRISGTSYTDTSIVANTTYGYKVQACNTSGCSDFSGSVTRAPIPAAPSNVTASSRSGYAYVSWSAVPGATSYVFKNVINTNTQPVSLTTTDHIETAVSIGGRYTYQVSACNGSGCSDYVNSNEVTIVAPEPGMPTGVKATASGSSIVVTWGAVNGATSYTIQKTVGGAVVSNFTDFQGISYTDAGLKENTTYTYNIKACNGSGCSPFSSSASATTPAYPAVPTSINLVLNGNSIVVNWSAVSNATSYTLWKTVGSAAPTSTKIAGVSYTDAGLALSTTYTYSVQACNDFGCSAKSDNASASTFGAISYLAAIQLGPTVRLAWPVVANATFYKLKRSGGAATITLPDTAGTNATDSSVSVDVDYIYSVQACHAGGCSLGKDAAKIRLPHIPAPPASLSAMVRQNLIYLTWPNADNATSFQLLKNAEVISNIGVPSYADAAVTKGTSYTYKVRACNATGCSAAVATATAVAGVVQAGTNVVEGYDYNVLGRLIKVKENGTVKTQYDYDNAGNRKQVSE